MTIDLPILFLAAFAYLSLLFCVAYIADKGYIPEKIVRHPIVYVLSLGVYATSWTYYGSVGYAEAQGYNFLTVYLGVTLAFMLTPVLLKPILRLTREYQLTSLADLFAFRYRSQLAGILVTLFMLVGTLPYIALQIRAVTESLRVLTQEATPHTLALGFCATLILFAILFGARHTSPREKHRGLVVAIAFESLVKLAAILVVGLFAVYGVFDGPGGMELWLQQHPEALEALYQPVREGPWPTLIFLSFAAAFLLPRQFHMIFTENITPGSLDTASWGFPLLLLLLTIAIPPVLWAGHHLQLETDADYYLLGITLKDGPSALSVFAFIGGVSAASAMMIVTTLALSSMCLNHLLLPASYPDPQVDLYRWVIWSRRLLIGMIVMAGYGFYALLETKQGLVSLGLISFVAVAQFLPGIVGVLYWSRATRTGFIVGLTGGIFVWGMTLLAPLMQQSGMIVLDYDLVRMQQTSGLDKWEFSTFWSLAVNVLLFTAVSLLTRPSQEEQETGHACCTGIFGSSSGTVVAASPDQFEERLRAVLGPEAAAREVQQALFDLNMEPREGRPAELRRLRERLERNLSGLIGPQLARMTITQELELNPSAQTALADTMRYAEERLEASRNRLRGMSAELDALRRYHREILLDLPLGVCSLSPDGEVVIWNLAMEVLSGVSRREAIGVSIDRLPVPWNRLLRTFVEARDHHVHKLRVNNQGNTHCFNLHKAAIENLTLLESPPRTGLVILIEDLTDLEMLESELAHSERLASVGRLAAGVAHEIGNPVTGIACLAQNLRDEDDPAVVRESIEQILEQTRRINEIVQSLMTFSHGGTTGPGSQPHSDEVDIAETVDEAMRFVRLSNSGKNVACENNCPRGLTVRGSHQRLLQVLVNLLSNACDASQPGDRVEISARRTDDGVRIDISDQGEGIPEEIRDRIFDPFFTTKQPGEGTGLGLPIVYRIVQDHSGTIDVLSEATDAPAEGRTGTRVVVHLPANSEGRLEKTA